MDKPKLVIVLLTLLGSTAPAMSQQVSIKWESAGKASYYGWERQGKLTSSGEVFDYHKLTAAHRTLPFGSIVLVTNTHNGKQVKVRINDRGPGYPDRIIDVSAAAAQSLGFDGLTDVTIAVLSLGPVTPDYFYLALRCRAGEGRNKPCGFYSSRDVGRQGIGKETARELQCLEKPSVAKGAQQATQCASVPHYRATPRKASPSWNVTAGRNSPRLPRRVYLAQSTLTVSRPIAE